MALGRVWSIDAREPVSGLKRHSLADQGIILLRSLPDRHIPGAVHNGRNTLLISAEMRRDHARCLGPKLLCPADGTPRAEQIGSKPSGSSNGRIQLSERTDLSLIHRKAS
jgi:hypothetical protein